ncbi:MAG TPA: hypothetical protein PLJ35_18245 [Anaerolineae bacterium]|nr:hypothetical protein [Anaerolineae bacterium]HOR00759.1 hypothetical protein [Anaerolineae bacterium]HPL28010.1 hypothetical protein [Anaerolineae bacterium]
MEILLVLIVAAIFVGPTAYRLFERFRHPQAVRAPRPSYLRRMLTMLTPVLIMAMFLALLTAGICYLGGR